MANTASKTKTKKQHESRLNDVFDAVTDEKARQAILSARVALVLKHGFFGNLAMRLRLVNADKWCETAATDGRHFYYNTKFILMLNAKQMMFLFCHELLHCAYDHITRGGKEYDQTLANIAMDYVVNADCIKHKLGDKITRVPLLYEPKYEGWTWEAVYDDLIKNAKKITIENLADMLLDDHLDSSDSDQEGKDGSKSNDANGNKNRPVLSESERKKIREEFKEALLSAAQAAGASNLPGGIKRIISELTEPKINWREFISQQIRSTIKNNYTWAVPNKKQFSNGFVLPSMMKEESIDICVAIDTSGSITDKMVHEFFSEIQGIMNQFSEYKIHVWCWDTEVHNPQEFVTHGSDDLMEYKLAGFGGTLSEVNWHFMKENKIEPKLLLVFTDGDIFGDWAPPGDEDYCPTVWLINNKHNKNIVPSFGQYTYYE